MRQVPHYLIIGNGRAASHFQYYFSLLQLSFSHWHRKQPFSLLPEKLKQATHVLLLIKDDAIEAFMQHHLQHASSIFIHFSGSLITSKAYGAHPLMTFNKHLYDVQTYQSIPFIIDHDAPPFAELLPGLPNASVRLDKALKPKYHALCVLSGNFSCILWQKLFSAFEHEFNLPASFAHLYLQQQTRNLLNDAENALTGPLVRGDHETMKKNIAALHNDAFQQVYKSFIESYHAGDKK